MPSQKEAYQAVFCTNRYSFAFFRQMELNPCENGSVKAEINQQEQTLIKSLACLNLETSEECSDVSVEDHIEENLAGKYIFTTFYPESLLRKWREV